MDSIILGKVSAPPSKPDRFWGIIGETLHAASREEQVAALKKELQSLSDDDLIWFAGDFRRAQEALDTRMLSIAADLAIYYCSDDGFVYFRIWVISRGRDAYEALRVNPDNLVTLLPEPDQHASYDLDFEEFQYVVGDVWQERSGGRIPFVEASEDPWEKGSDLGAGTVYAALREEDTDPDLQEDIDLSRALGMSWSQIRDETGYPEEYEPNMMDVPLDEIPQLLPRIYAWGQAAFGLTLEEFRSDPLLREDELYDLDDADSHTGWEIDDVEAPPSDPDRFWEIIDQTVGAGSDEAQIAALKALLTDLSDEDLLWFRGDFRRAHDALNVWLLWVAADFAMEFCSDDGFHYFRSWLISRGRAAYERVHANPDELAGLLPTPEGCERYLFCFEELEYVAGDVWSARHESEMSFVDTDDSPWQNASDLGVGLAYSGVSPHEAPESVRAEVISVSAMGISWDQIRSRTGYPETYEPNFMRIPLDRIPEALPRMYAWGQAAFGMDLEVLRQDPLTRPRA